MVIGKKYEITMDTDGFKSKHVGVLTNIEPKQEPDFQIGMFLKMTWGLL